MTSKPTPFPTGVMCMKKSWIILQLLQCCYVFQSFFQTYFHKLDLDTHPWELPVPALGFSNFRPRQKFRESGIPRVFKANFWPRVFMLKVLKLALLFLLLGVFNFYHFSSYFVRNPLKEWKNTFKVFSCPDLSWLVVFSYILLYLDVFGHFWIYLDILGCNCTYLDVFGRTWT